MFRTVSIDLPILAIVIHESLDYYLAVDEIGLRDAKLVDKSLHAVGNGFSLLGFVVYFFDGIDAMPNLALEHLKIIGNLAIKAGQLPTHFPQLTQSFAKRP